MAKKTAPKETPTEETKQAESVPASPKEMLAEIDKWKQKARYQEMRAEAFNKMIDIAEERFNIQIRKKSGAKQ